MTGENDPGDLLKPKHLGSLAPGYSTPSATDVAAARHRWYFAQLLAGITFLGPKRRRRHPAGVDSGEADVLDYPDIPDVDAE